MEERKTKQKSKERILFWKKKEKEGKIGMEKEGETKSKMKKIVGKRKSIALRRKKKRVKIQYRVGVGVRKKRSSNCVKIESIKLISCLFVGFEWLKTLCCQYGSLYLVPAINAIKTIQNEECTYCIIAAVIYYTAHCWDYFFIH